jgi:hypothetical protein
MPDYYFYTDSDLTECSPIGYYLEPTLLVTDTDTDGCETHDVYVDVCVDA